MQVLYCSRIGICRGFYFCGGKKSGEPGEKPSEKSKNQQQTQPTYMIYGTEPESHQCLTDGRQVLATALFLHPYNYCKVTNEFSMLCTGKIELKNKFQIVNKTQAVAGMICTKLFWLHCVRSPLLYLWMHNWNTMKMENALFYCIVSLLCGWGGGLLYIQAESKRDVENLRLFKVREPVKLGPH